MPYARQGKLVQDKQFRLKIIKGAITSKFEQGKGTTSCYEKRTTRHHTTPARRRRRRSFTPMNEIANEEATRAL